MPALASLSCLIVIIWGLSEASQFLLPIIIAGFLGFLMAPLHNLLMRKLKLPDALAVVVSAIVLLSPLVIFILLLIQQGRGLVQDIPGLLNTAQAKLQNFIAHDPLAEKLGLDENSDLGNLVQKMTSSVGAGLGFVVGSLAAIAGAGSQILLVFVFSVLFLTSRVHLRKSAEHIFAKNREFDSSSVMDQATDLIQRFLVARMAIVLIVGVAGCLALKLMDVRYSIFLGTFFGVLTLVPAIGSIIAISIAAVTALITGHSGGSTVLIVIVLFGISAIENYVLTPKLVGNRLNLNALTCFVGLLAGGLLWGIWGMFLSIPLIGVLRIVFASVPSMQAWSELLADKSSETIQISPKKL